MEYITPLSQGADIMELVNIPYNKYCIKQKLVKEGSGNRYFNQGCPL